MPERTPEDHLRDEYFKLLPEIRLVAEELETEVRYSLLPISRDLRNHELVVVKARIKSCESAISALRADQQAFTFESERAESYSLQNLKDLAGVRVIAFPRALVMIIDEKLRTRFPSWISDPVPGDPEDLEPRASKYHGYCQASRRIKGELQIVPMLTALFWEVEHPTIYKPSPEIEAIASHPEMTKSTAAVFRALRAFEEQFENLLRNSPLASRNRKDQF